MNKKKILLFSLVYYPDFVGGAEVAIKEITDRLGDRFDFHMVTMRTNREKTDKIGNITVHRVGPYLLGVPFIGKILFHLSKYMFPFASYRYAKKLHKEENYDMTWAMMANYAGFGVLFFKLKFPKVNFLLTLQEGDPIPYIKRRVALVYPLFKMIFMKADKIQAISKYLEDFGKSMGFKGESFVVPNAVDTSIFSEKPDPISLERVREEVGKEPSDILLVTSSRLVKKNGVGDVISALAILPKEYKFLILGSGPLEKKLRKLALNLGVEKRVIWKGYVPHREMPGYLYISDVFIRPSLSEGLGNAFLEAMATGLPVVATPVGGIPDFLVDGETGVFCEVEKPDSIRDAVLRFRDDTLRNKIIFRARNMVEEKYTWEMVVSKMRVIFDE